MSKLKMEWYNGEMHILVYNQKITNSIQIYQVPGILGRNPGTLQIDIFRNPFTCCSLITSCEVESSSYKKI